MPCCGGVRVLYSFSFLVAAWETLFKVVAERRCTVQSNKEQVFIHITTTTQQPHLFLSSPSYRPPTPLSCVPPVMCVTSPIGPRVSPGAEGLLSCHLVRTFPMFEMFNLLRGMGMPWKRMQSGVGSSALDHLVCWSLSPARGWSDRRWRVVFRPGAPSSTSPRAGAAVGAQGRGLPGPLAAHTPAEEAAFIYLIRF